MLEYFSHSANYIAGLIMHKDVNYLLKLIPQYHTQNPDIVVWIRDTTLQHQLYVTPAYEDVWGRTCASLYNEPLKWGDTLYYADRHKRSVSAVLTGIEANKSVDYVEVFRIVKPDNGVHWIEDRCFPLVDNARKHVGFAGISVDITLQMFGETTPDLLNRSVFDGDTFSLSELVRQTTMVISVKNCFKEKIFFNTTLDKKIPLFLRGNKKNLESLFDNVLTQSIKENKISTVNIEFKMKDYDKTTKEIGIKILLKSTRSKKEIFPAFDIVLQTM